MLLPGEDDLTYVPMAVRRALDRAGLKITLPAWRALSLPVRTTLVAIGGAPEVDVVKVRELLDLAAPEDIEPTPDPPVDRVPPAVAALGADVDAWRTLGPVARHALDSYARRGKAEKLRALYDSLTTSPGESQSSR